MRSASLHAMIVQATRLGLPASEGALAEPGDGDRLGTI
jgi:hypothetical protein